MGAQPRDLRESLLTTDAEAHRLERHEPAALLLVEAADEHVEVTMQGARGVGVRARHVAHAHGCTSGRDIGSSAPKARPSAAETTPRRVMSKA